MTFANQQKRFTQTIQRKIWLFLTVSMDSGCWQISGRLTSSLQSVLCVQVPNCLESRAHALTRRFCLSKMAKNAHREKRQRQARVIKGRILSSQFCFIILYDCDYLLYLKTVVRETTNFEEKKSILYIMQSCV